MERHSPKPLSVDDRSVVRFSVSGMDCGSCAAKVTNAVRRLRGVREVDVSVASGSMSVVHDGADVDGIVTEVAALGYRAEAISEPGGTIGGATRGPSHHHDHSYGHAHDHASTEGPWYASAGARLTIACGVALAMAYVVGRAFPAADRWVFLAAMAVGLVPVARRAYAAAIRGTPFSIEGLMVIAAVGAVLIGATEEAAAVVFLFLVGELLEGVAAGRARASIRSLTDLVPDLARVERDGVVVEVPASSLRVGDVVTVRPGDRVPADGRISSGESAIDEAPITGESVPRRKRVDDPVFAGTVNGDGLITVSVTATASDNTIARVVRLVEEAQESKAPTERFIDRFSRYYTPGVVAVAALVAVVPPLAFGGVWGEWIYKGLAILLIGCPCALVISTPAAVAAGLSAGARRGLLLKGGAALEGIGRVDVVAFDKTGTLTEGKPTVTDVVAWRGERRDVLRLAAALEAGSSHPLAKAILEEAAGSGASTPPAASARAVGGVGVTGEFEGAQVFLGSVSAAGERATLTSEQLLRVDALRDEGKTVSVLVSDATAVGLIALRDEPRADAVEGLAALRRLGIATLMVTGDNRRAATAIATRLDIEARADLLPQDKLVVVNALKAAGRRVAKVGDGINDAPALAAADVGIAMGGGADVALETADAAILHGRVADVARMVELSRRTMSNIRANVTIALGLKVVFLMTTVAGVTGLWPAILADTGATVLVTANALRLLRS